jgi:prephenate dehydrogenase
VFDSFGFPTVGIVGVGLIGASFGLALKKRGYQGRILGAGRTPTTLQVAQSIGAIDEIVNLETACQQADLLYLAAPVETIVRLLPSIAQQTRPETLITDAGSTKRTIQAVADQLELGDRFLGGHPMAGKAESGPQHADAELFVQRPYVLNRADPRFSTIVEKVGARLMVMDAEKHDRLVALCSHVPQLLSTALAATVHDLADPADLEADRLPVGPGLQDMVRLSTSSYELWRDILASNHDYIGFILEEYTRRLNDLRDKLGTEYLQEEWAKASQTGTVLRQRKR